MIIHPARVLAFVLASAYSCVFGAPWSPPYCPSLTPRLAFDSSEPEVSHAAGFEGIRTLAKASSHSASRMGFDIAVGAYIPQLILITDYEVSVNSQNQPGLYAVCFSRMDLAVRFTSKIHIASELPLGGCSEQAAYAHEYIHYRIQSARQQEALKAFFSQNTLPQAPFTSASRDQAIFLAKQYVQAYGESMMASVVNFTQPAQDAFDTPEEYRRVSELCGAEIAPILRSARARAD